MEKKQHSAEGRCCGVFGCHRDAVSVVKDGKGRAQYRCSNHNGTKKIEERKNDRR